jgi:long-chain fatty acid transport protein
MSPIIALLSWLAKSEGGYPPFRRGTSGAILGFPVVPDENAHILSWGIGLTCRRPGRFIGMVSCGGTTDNRFGLKSIGLDLAYQAMFFESRLITGNPNPAVNGQYDRRSDVGTVTLRLNY